MTGPVGSGHMDHDRAAEALPVKAQRWSFGGGPPCSMESSNRSAKAQIQLHTCDELPQPGDYCSRQPIYLGLRCPVTATPRSHSQVCAEAR